MSDVLLRGRFLDRDYMMGDQVLPVLKNIDIQINKGDALCIVGGSGAGKSTLLHILGGLDRPSRGDAGDSRVVAYARGTVFTARVKHGK